jgi:hypothetical protein
MATPSFDDGWPDDELAVLEAAVTAAEVHYAAHGPSVADAGLSSAAPAPAPHQLLGTACSLPPPVTHGATGPLRAVTCEAVSPTTFVVYGPACSDALDALRRELPAALAEVDRGAVHPTSWGPHSEPHLALQLRHYEAVVRVLDKHRLLPAGPGARGHLSGRIPPPTLAALRRVAAANTPGTSEHAAQVRHVA